MVEKRAFEPVEPLAPVDSELLRAVVCRPVALRLEGDAEERRSSSEAEACVLRYVCRRLSTVNKTHYHSLFISVPCLYLFRVFVLLIFPLYFLET